jgi:site-specific DNA-methyltransferase (adenine-specific)
MIKIYCCDALYFLQGIDDKSVDMILTDPMNTKDPEFNLSWLREAHRVLKDSKVLCSFCTPSTLDAFIEQAKAAGFTHLKTILRNNGMTGTAEPCILLGPAKNLPFGDEPFLPDAWGCDPAPEEEAKGFPFVAQKPLHVIKELIEAFTKEGDLVIDFFLGSGTTAQACKETGRDFKGCELNLEFCEVARTRLGFENLYTTGQ